MAVVPALLPAAGSATGRPAVGPARPAPRLARPLPWVSPVLYVAVLAGGLYYGIVSGRHASPASLVGLVGGLALLLGLDAAEWRRYGVRTPPGPAVALLLARVAAFGVVAAADGSGLSRVLFVLVPFTAYFAFGRATSIALAGACVGVLLTGYALLVPGWYTDPRYVSDVLMLCIGLVLAVSMAAVAAGEQQGRVRLEHTLRELARSHDQLAAYTTQVAELSATAERNRLARDIHDSLGQHLTAISVQLEKAAAYRDRDPAVAQQAHADARSSARRALEEARQSVRALRAETPPFRLSAALAELARQVDDDTFRVTVEVVGPECGYGTGSLVALYRAAQEGLTNARRHGHATHASVSVRFDDSGARLVVTDNGRGFHPTGPATAGGLGHGGLGLLGMAERVQLLGGRLQVDSSPGAGAVITVTLPTSSTMDDVGAGRIP
jgi:signal transduction histidine kinase